jgi:ornithine--oxo-acid transaminase
LLYFLGAFDAASRRTIESIAPVERRVEASEAEAVQFTCNVINAGSEIVMHAAKGTIANRLYRLGYRVTEPPLNEFIRSGGSAKSLALCLSDLTVTHRTNLRHFRTDDRIFGTH